MNDNKVIGEHEYSVPKFNATKQMILKARLLKYAGAGISKIVGNAGESKADQIGAVAAAIGEMVATHSEKEVVNLIKEITCMAIRDGERMMTARFRRILQRRSSGSL